MRHFCPPERYQEAAAGWRKSNKSILGLLNENNHFNYYGYAAVEPHRCWQGQGEVAADPGDGLQVWAGLQGNDRVVWRRLWWWWWLW